MTQRDKILNYLDRYGSISPMEAYADLKITKLATRISEMKKDGMNFVGKMVYTKNGDGETVCYKRYWRE